LDVLSLSFFLAIALLYSFLKLGAILGNIAGLAYLVFFFLRFSRLYIRRIIFTPSYFLVEKYVWPSKKINYSDVIDLGISKVKTRRGEISLVAMNNIAELRSLFIDLLRQGTIDIDQFENKAIGEDLVLDNSFWPSLVVTIVLSVIFLVYWFYQGSDLSLLDVLIILSLVAVVVTSAVQWIYKRRRRDQ
jgi:hypothetical protein